MHRLVRIGLAPGRRTLMIRCRVAWFCEVLTKIFLRAFLFSRYLSSIRLDAVVHYLSGVCTATLTDSNRVDICSVLRCSQRFLDS